VKHGEHIEGARTLAEVLRRRAVATPDALAYTFLTDGDTEGGSFTYGQLDRHSRAIAAQLIASGSVGDRVLLLYPHGLSYVAAFFGCLYAARVPVPGYPPEPKRMHRTVPRLAAIAADAGAAMIATTAEVRGLLDSFRDRAPEIARPRWLITDGADAWDELLEAPIRSDALTLLQYTSGSTGTPKGVMVSHENFMYTFRDFDETCGFDASSVGVSWLPQFHDLGLIYGILQPVYSGYPAYLMDPLAFLLQPLRWLRAITRYRGTLSAAPNFAYELCCKKITAEERAELDLASWKVAMNAAEPIRKETIDRFVELFGPAGFRRGTFKGGYGLAEATLKVSMGTVGQEPSYVSLDVGALEDNRVVASVAREDTRVLVGCGPIYRETEVAIVDPEQLTVCPADGVGEIWVRGPAVAQGYWNREQETEATFRARIAGSGEGPFMRTGDLGFVRDGEVYIAGRWKDLIIVRGRNLHPHDLELTSERSHPALRPGCGAAFAIEQSDEERVLVAHERDPRRPGEPEEIIWAIRSAIAEEHEIHVQGVLLLAAGTLPKTSSGKVQRRECRRLYLTGALETTGSWIAPRAAGQPADA
jgi:acyl-CoA synthetase (AMP-forming)/AMP-acid ligase II